MTKKIEIELPELTQAQAESFELSKIGYKGYKLFDKAIDCGLSSYKYAIALRYGYTIKQEPKYYIHLLKNSSFGYLNIDKLSKDESIYDNKENEQCQTQFTEAEIKAIDPRYWEFRELVEDE